MNRTALLLVLVPLLGCNAATVGDGGGDPGEGGVGGFVDAGEDQLGSDRDDDTIPDVDDNCPALANPEQADGDGDGYGDACDCDPADGAVAAYLVVEDALDADRGLLSAAPGFPAASWSYQDGAYRQTRLANDADDVSLLDTEPLTDVLVTATAASTEITDFDAQDLRQLLLVARAEAKADDFDALACGIEVAEGLTPTQKTSALRLAGPPANLATTVDERTDRTAVQVDEEFRIEMELRGGSMTCRVTLGNGEVSTARATGLPVRAGALGLHTRETKALYKSLRVCRY